MNNASMNNTTMNNTITSEKLEKYFSMTKRALEKAKVALDESRLRQAEEFLDMAQRYYDDAQYFLNEKNDAVLAFAAVNYAHGWLDAGARIGLFEVDDTYLFAAEKK